MPTKSQNTAFLGSGLKYPIEFDDYGKPIYLMGIDLVKQSIKTYLEFSKGEIFFLRECGTKIQELLFDANDTILEGALYAYVKDTIDTWEKRVQFQKVEFSYPNEVSISLRIYFKVLGSNEIDSFIFPYYRTLKY